MNGQKGITLVEVLVIVAMASVILLATAVFTVPWLNREAMRSAVYDVQTYIQLARIEAVSRNRPCSFVVNPDTRRLRVFDMMGTADPFDDQLLYDTTLPDKIDFTRPDAGAPVTLQQIGATSNFVTVFNSDGSVDLGTGDVVLFGGDRFGRISVFAAGGTQVERWANGNWHVGS